MLFLVGIVAGSLYFIIKNIYDYLNRRKLLQSIYLSAGNYVNEFDDQENDDKRQLLREELRRLYYQLDLLNNLEEMQQLDFDWYKRTNNEKAYKQALQTVSKIHSIQKKIDTIEYKLKKLDL